MELFIDNEPFTQVVEADGNPMLTETGEFIFSRNSGGYGDGVVFVKHIKRLSVA